MKLVWSEQLSDIRKKEIEIIFSNIKKKEIGVALEIGAGEGYQIEFLSKISRKVICTDFNVERLKEKKIKNVKYQECDAENLRFKNEEFDLIYSSNLLEHIKSPEKALSEMKRCLRNNGIMIHTIPNEYMKILHILLFYPHLLIRLIEKIKRGSKPVDFKSYNNNLKSVIRVSLFKKAFLHPHGENKNNIEELIKFRNLFWIRLFKRSNLVVHKRIKLLYYSPYGFGFKRLNRFMKRLGFCTSYAYVMSKG